MEEFFMQLDILILTALNASYSSTLLLLEVLLSLIIKDM
jgi:hypothetical protein